MIVRFPMYRTEAVDQAYQALWEAILQGLPEHLVEILPTSVSQDSDEELIAHWQSTETILSQTCGYPLLTELSNQPLVVPHYAVEGCEGANYRSVILVRADNKVRHLQDLYKARPVISERDSWSGHHTLLREFARLGRSHRLEHAFVSGSHVGSIEVLLNNRADFCAVDCVTWHHLQQSSPEAIEGTRVLSMTAPSLGLPWISNAPRRIQSALQTAILALDLESDFAKTLALSGFSLHSREDYETAMAL
ncbi:MAG: PhnD/SsuA/transferrin family substrate-binding protein [Gammaproteobacteria bacterium]|nr:PhnD/SsuA/transferrin family substrate-binding protein [Gammaproteobacteria bacterium]